MIDPLPEDAHWNKKARENTITQLKKITQTHPALTKEINTLITNINKIQDTNQIKKINEEIKKMNTTLDQITNKGYEELKRIEIPRQKGLFYCLTRKPLVYAITLLTALGITTTTPQKSGAEDLPVFVQREDRVINPKTGETLFKRGSGLYNDKGLVGITNSEGNIQYGNPPTQPTVIIQDQTPPKPQYQQQNEETQASKYKKIAENYVKKSEFDNAIKTLEKALNEKIYNNEDEFLELNYALASNYSTIGKYDKSIKHFRIVIDKNPNNKLAKYAEYSITQVRIFQQKELKGSR